MDNYVANEDFEEGSYQFKEEVIAWALGQAARDARVQSDLMQSKNGLINALKRFWKAIKEMIFGKDAPLYHNIYDFVKDGLTFGEITNFLAESPDKIKLNDLDALSLDKANAQKEFEIVETNPVEDSVQDNFSKNYLLPVVINEVISEVNSVSKEKTNLKKKIKLKKFAENVRKKLLEKFNIPKSLRDKEGRLKIKIVAEPGEEDINLLEGSKPVLLSG